MQTHFSLHRGWVFKSILTKSATCKSVTGFFTTRSTSTPRTHERTGSGALLITFFFRLLLHPTNTYMHDRAPVRACVRAARRAHALHEIFCVRSVMFLLFLSFVYNTAVLCSRARARSLPFRDYYSYEKSREFFSRGACNFPRRVLLRISTP